MTDPAQIVTLDAVTVVYGSQRALSDVTTSFAAGAVGLLGPNGAGKSTMIKSLLGFIAPTRGRMRVLGLDVAVRRLQIRARVGYMPESDAHIPGMNAVSFVAYCGELSGLPRADAMQRAHEVLFYVGLGEARYRNVETYSTGMKQRIKLAQALVHDPDLLLARRADQRHGSEGPRRDARAGPRPRPQQGRQRHRLVAPAARHRIHLRPRGRHGQGTGRDRGADRGAEAAARTGVRAAREGAGRAGGVRRASPRRGRSSATRPTTT